jgi:N6-adenosine-specific RNA methylase IME4/ParB-like chromosome segregation protein Spo0J
MHIEPRASHPAADLMPPMTADEYASMRESIRTQGQLVPITLHPDGRILDGRHRASICAELGREPIVETYTGSCADDDLLAYVIGLNKERRHLNESQCAMLAVEIANMGEGRPSKTASREAVSQAEAAQRLGVSRSSVQRAAIVKADAIPEIAEAVRNGDMALKHAAVAARLTPQRQQHIAANMHNGKSMTTLVLAATRQERVEAIERKAQHVPLSMLCRRFPVILADPPWHFEAFSEGGQQKAPAMQYPTMPVDDLCKLPVAEIAARDAVLFMWAVPATFPDALAVVAAWGFTFKTFAVRVKRNMACGLWLRGQHDPLIIATRGNMPPPPELHSSVFFDDGPRLPHSGKPDAVRDWIASAYPDAGRIELFARSAAPGWYAWGNQAPEQAA